ncbi:helix-turn-helix domain-containing protein [Brevibacterium daeguense]|nr:helix-turn-helix domain-containing protein [Brevibacterium daeguense]
MHEIEMDEPTRTWTVDLDHELADGFSSMLNETHLTFRTRITTRDGWAKSGRATRTEFGDLTLVDFECGPSAGRRDAREIASSDEDYVVVLVNRFGRESVSQGGNVFTLTPGDVVVWDTSSPATFEVHDWYVKRSLFIPRRILEGTKQPYAARTGYTMERRAPGVQLFIDYVDILSRTGTRLEAGARENAGRAALELFLGAARPDLAVRDATEETGSALFAVVVRYIDQHLRDPDLSPEKVARIHHVSVRTINRLFAAVGETFTHHVRQRRLDCAYADVALSTESVGLISQRWSFADSSHFSRLFKEKFGRTPSAVRAEAS